MRAALACLVLATAIAIPGIVVAAISSGGSGSVFYGSSTTRAVEAPIATGPVRPPPIDPVLRPAVSALKRAFAARGIRLVVQSAGSGSAEAFDLTASTGCPTFIVFSTSTQGSTSFGSSCGSERMQIKGVTITYTPASVGAIVREAVAGLPR